MKVAVIIPAAGAGLRTGLKTPKPFLDVGGHPLVFYCLRTLHGLRNVRYLQPVLPRGRLELFRRRIIDRYRFGKCLPPVPGGRERQDSVLLGLRALPEGVDMVVVHDAARPLVPARLVRDVLEAAIRHGAAIAAVPAQDTLKRASSGLRIRSTLDRSGLWHAQTPQAFRLRLLVEAHERAAAEGFRGTDDAALLERLGLPVRIVPGSKRNLKVTTREDVALVRALIRPA